MWRGTEFLAPCPSLCGPRVSMSYGKSWRARSGDLPLGQYSMFYVSCTPGVERVKLAVTMSIKRRSQIRLSPVNGLMCRVPRS